MDGYLISEEPLLTDDEARQIRAGIAASDPYLDHPRNYARLAFTIRDSEGGLLGGLLGATIWKWLVIDSLWVSQDARGRGLGDRLMVAAFDLAMARGCSHARLDTFDFQARTFYERHGFQVYGELKGFPDGHSQLHMWRELLQDN